MKISEIRKKYHNKWVLIEANKYDKNYNVVEGKVLVDSPFKDHIYRALLKYKGKQLAIEYFGVLPKEMTVLL